MKTRDTMGQREVCETLGITYRQFDYWYAAMFGRYETRHGSGTARQLDAEMFTRMKKLARLKAKEQAIKAQIKEVLYG